MFNDIFARPCYVGWNWCGWMDSWKDLQDSKQHGRPANAVAASSTEPMRKAIAEFSATMYDIATR